MRRFEGIRGGSLEIHFPSGRTRRFGKRGTGLDARV